MKYLRAERKPKALLRKRTTTFSHRENIGKASGCDHTDEQSRHSVGGDTAPHQHCAQQPAALKSANYPQDCSGWIRINCFANNNEHCISDFPPKALKPTARLREHTNVQVTHMCVCVRGISEPEAGGKRWGPPFFPTKLCYLLSFAPRYQAQ